MRNRDKQRGKTKINNRSKRRDKRREASVGLAEKEAVRESPAVGLRQSAWLSPVDAQRSGYICTSGRVAAAVCGEYGEYEYVVGVVSEYGELMDTPDEAESSAVVCVCPSVNDTAVVLRCVFCAGNALSAIAAQSAWMAVCDSATTDATGRWKRRSHRWMHPHDVPYASQYPQSEGAMVVM